MNKVQGDEFWSNKYIVILLELSVNNVWLLLIIKLNIIIYISVLKYKYYKKNLDISLYSFEQIFQNNTTIENRLWTEIL